MDCGVDLCRSLAVDILATACFSVNCCRFMLQALPTWFMGASYRLKKSDKHSNIGCSEIQQGTGASFKF